MFTAFAEALFIYLVFKYAIMNKAVSSHHENDYQFFSLLLFSVVIII